MKKKILFRTIAIIAIVFFAFIVEAQVPQSINYQAVLRNTTGQIIQNQTATVKFTIHQATTNGVVVYEETQTATTNDYGLINLQIGQGVPVVGTLSAIQWGTNSYFLQVWVDIGGGYIDLGTTQFITVPYAMVADTALHCSVSGTKIAINTTQATANTNGVETTLYTIPIPGGILGTNNAIKFKIPCSAINARLNVSISIKMYYGTTLITTLNFSSSTNADCHIWEGEINGYIIADNATNAQKALITILKGDAQGGINNNAQFFLQSKYGTSAEDSNVIKNLVITAIPYFASGYPNPSITTEAIIVEAVR
ncbi:MAG: hypothetical protein WC264_02595 [Candidatus Paceibacterota bacterium]|jgi:hypothetical protein